MEIVDSLKRRLRRAGKALSRKSFPRSIVIEDLAPAPLRFTVHNRVEEHRIAAYGGEYEILKRFLDLLQPADIVFDVGASVGLYTVAAAALVDRGMVYAFEPDPETRMRLEENVLLNQFGNVQSVPWAVSDSEGTVTLYSDGAAGFAPSLVLQTRKGAPSGQVSVSTRSLDIALSRSELPIPDILKIDIEGAESICLRGSERLLKGEFGKRPRSLLLELHPEVLPAFGSSPQQIREFMTRVGYELTWTETRASEEHLCYAASVNGPTVK